MSTTNANVTPGKIFIPDSEGRILLTVEDINRLGTPTVTIEGTDSVAEEDIKDGAVTAAKLGALAVTEAKIGALAVTEGKLGALAVTEGKLGALAVSAAKLADLVADAILQGTATVGAESTNTITVTLQLKDIQGNSLAEQRMVSWWLTDTDVPGPISSAGLTTPYVAYSQGVQVKSWTANYHESAATNTSGQLILVFTSTSAQTRYFRCQVGSLLIKGSVAMAWS